MPQQSSVPQQWYFDSGATNHITHTLQNIDQPQSSSLNNGVLVGNGSSLPISHIGKGLLPTPKTTFQLTNILHTPSITHNLISVYQFSKDNHCSLIFDTSGLVIQDKNTNQILYKGPCNQGLYPILNFSKRGLSTSSPAVLLSTTDSAMLWHRRLGHPSLPLFHALIKQNNLPVIRPYEFHCTECNMAKSHKLQFSVSTSHTTAPFQLVHMDVWGPSPIPSNKGFRYYLLVIDDFTRYSWLFPPHYKSEVKHKIAQFKAFVSNQFHTSIQIVRSDNGGEFINHFLLHLFLTTGVLHPTTCPHTPEQHGVVERKHRHLIETTVTLLLQAGLPSLFWLEALLTAVYLTNRMPHSSLQYQVPYSLLFQSSPNYLSLKPFGCCCYPWLKPYAPNKLAPKSTPCVFLGYCDNTKGYRCYDPISTKVYTSRHVKFVENEFPFSALISQYSPPSSESVSSHLNFPLTDFSDLVVSVSVPIPPPSSLHSLPTSSSSVPSSAHPSIPHVPSSSSSIPISSPINSAQPILPIVSVPSHSMTV